MEPAELLRTARRRHGLSQAALARRAGTSQPVISAYEHGRRDPSTHTLRRLLAAAGDRLELRLAPQSPAVPPATTREAQAERLVDVLLLADAIPHRPRPALDFPRDALEVTRRSLPDKIVAIDRALHATPHAFGGALALAYHAEPRATIDIDVNVFVPTERAAEVLAPLAGLGAEVTGAEEAIRRDGQVRVMWDGTPIDLFFSYDRFHDAAAMAAIEVPFADVTICVLSPEHLTTCKVVFDRPKDWVDIETMITMGTHIETAEVLRWVGRIAGDEDPRYDRIAALLSATG